MRIESGNGNLYKRVISNIFVLSYALTYSNLLSPDVRRSALSLQNGELQHPFAICSSLCLPIIRFSLHLLPASNFTADLVICFISLIFQEGKTRIVILPGEGGGPSLMAEGRFLYVNQWERRFLFLLFLSRTDNYSILSLFSSVCLQIVPFLYSILKLLWLSNKLSLFISAYHNVNFLNF